MNINKNFYVNYFIFERFMMAEKAKLYKLSLSEQYKQLTFELPDNAI